MENFLSPRKRTRQSTLNFGSNKAPKQGAEPEPAIIIEDDVNDHSNGETRATQYPVVGIPTKHQQIKIPKKTTDISAVSIADTESGILLNWETKTPRKDVPSNADQNLIIYSSPADAIAVSVHEYDSVNHACFKAGKPAPFLHLARTFQYLCKETKRLKIIDALANCFRTILELDPSALTASLYLFLGRIGTNPGIRHLLDGPRWNTPEMNVGGSIISSAVSEVTGVKSKRLHKLYNEHGDLGDVAQICLKIEKVQSLLFPPPPLTIAHVFKQLHQISRETGKGSTQKRKTAIINLLRSCKEEETKFLVRILCNNLRIGASEKTILCGLSRAYLCNTLPKSEWDRYSKEYEGIFKHYYNTKPDFESLVKDLQGGGIEKLKEAKVTPGIPVKPMLAKVAASLKDVSESFGEAAYVLDYKYDGQRAQIHLDSSGKVTIFSRNLEDNTSRWPDIIEVLQKHKTPFCTSFILDAEIVAIDRSKGEILAFQELSTRNKKDVDTSNLGVSTCLFLFDLISLNENSMIEKSLRERRKILETCFGFKEGFIEMVKSLETKDEDQMQAFLSESLKQSEGLIVKLLDHDSTYQPSKRSDSWVKVKKDYIEGLQDSLDLVPIGAWYGNGRKAAWFSPWLMAVYDEENEEYQSVCRVMSGFSDDFYADATTRFKQKITDRKHYFQTGEEPPIWFEPSEVWEIRGADFTISPKHKAAVGLCDPSKGISMRFPRFIRVRTDKNPEDASTPTQIAEMFRTQSRFKVTKQLDSDEEM